MGQNVTLLPFFLQWTNGKSVTLLSYLLKRYGNLLISWGHVYQGHTVCVASASGEVVILHQ
jgi:hypothetical protein